MKALEQKSYSWGRKTHFGVCRTYEVYAPPGEAEHKWAHEGWEIFFAPDSKIKPQKNLRFRGQEHAVTPGEILLFNSREEHTEVYSADLPAEYSVLVVCESLVQSLLENTGVEAKEVVFDAVKHRLPPEVAQSIAAIFRLREGGASARFAFECLNVEVILKILETCSSSASARIKGAAGEGRYPSNVARAKRILSGNLANQDFTLEELSREAGISKFHLIRSFKAQTGLSPIHYLAELRYELAKSLLEKGQSVSEVALATGFNSFSTFRKAFKQRSGKSPSDYGSQIY